MFIIKSMTSIKHEQSRRCGAVPMRRIGTDPGATTTTHGVFPVIIDRRVVSSGERCQQTQTHGSDAHWLVHTTTHGSTNTYDTLYECV